MLPGFTELGIGRMGLSIRCRFLLNAVTLSSHVIAFLRIKVSRLILMKIVDRQALMIIEVLLALILVLRALEIDARLLEFLRPHAVLGLQCVGCRGGRLALG